MKEGLDQVYDALSLVDKHIGYINDQGEIEPLCYMLTPANQAYYQHSADTALCRPAESDSQ